MIDDDSTVSMLQRLCEDQREMIRRKTERLAATISALAHVGALVGKSDLPQDQKSYIVRYIEKAVEESSRS